ncbi:SDR family oxidoreductase [Sinorhizobium meliloti]|uniref:SDR family NAD(P)-dependent oxidoreductase n=1 Tax=Rhizobium meliloti TaxID=382 RepID=UPI0030D25C70
MSIFVSGAAGGIGKGACTVLKSRGEHVIGQDLVGGEFVSPNMIGDLRSADFIERIERTLSAGLQDGNLTGVVAAHGVSGAGRLSEIGRARAETIMEINFESVVTLFEKVRAPLEKSGGAFVVIVSQAGLVGEAGNGIYCASKFALSGWLRGLAKETSIRLRAIHPGGIRTPLLDNALRDMAAAQFITYEELTAKRYGSLPAGRLGEPNELGELIALALALRAPGLVETAITGGEVLW